MSFISLRPRLARRDFTAAIGSCSELTIPAPWAPVDPSQIVPSAVNHEEISQWDERGQAWRVCSPPPHRCGWEAHSNMYIPVSSSGIQLPLESPLLTNRSALSSSRGPTERDKDISPVSLQKEAVFYPYLTSHERNTWMPLHKRRHDKTNISPRRDCIGQERLALCLEGCLGNKHVQVAVSNVSQAALQFWKYVNALWWLKAALCVQIVQ